MERASALLRRLSVSPSNAPLAPFLAAAVGHGDVSFSPLTFYPCEILLGLADGHGRLENAPRFRPGNPGTKQVKTGRTRRMGV